MSSKKDEEVPARWRRAAKKAKAALEKSKAERELGLKRPALTAAGGPQASDFKNTRRRKG